MEGINQFDASVMDFVQRNFHNAFSDSVFPIFTYLGEAGAFWLLLSVCFLFFKKKRAWGVSMLCAIAFGFLVGEVLVKNIVCRPRPFAMFPDYTTLLISAPDGFSFPSGHSCASFAAATVLYGYSRKWGVPALILAVLIAFSRVFLFVHWPTDILAGILLGIFSGILSLLLVKPRLDRLDRKQNQA